MTLTKSKYYFEALDFYPYNLAECMEALNYALSYEPEDANSLCLMGRVYYEQLKNYEMAKCYFEQAMLHDVTNTNTPQYYINCLINNDDLDEAEKLIDYSLRLKGIEKSILYYYRSQISEKRGSYFNAMKFLKEGEKFCFSSCSLDLLKERKKFVKSKMPKKLKKKKEKETK